MERRSDRSIRPRAEGQPHLGPEAVLGPRWRRESYSTDARTLAAGLIGQLLVRRLADGRTLAGRIVETEAYIGVRDRASHAYGGRRTARNESMYGQAGTAYVYFTYGMHYCFNVVCAEVGEPAAVLVRALEPVLGADQMGRLRAQARGRSDDSIPLRDVCRGPARLCRALAIGPEFDGADLTRDHRLWIAAPVERSENKVRRTARIGVDYAGEWAGRRLRWIVVGSRFVSGPVVGPSAARSSDGRGIQ